MFSYDRTSGEPSKAGAKIRVTVAAFHARKIRSGSLVRLQSVVHCLSCASRRMVASGVIGLGARRFLLIFEDWGFTGESLHV